MTSNTVIFGSIKLRFSFDMTVFEGRPGWQERCLDSSDFAISLRDAASMYSRRWLLKLVCDCLLNMYSKVQMEMLDKKTMVFVFICFFLATVALSEGFLFMYALRIPTTIIEDDYVWITLINPKADACNNKYVGKLIKSYRLLGIWYSEFCVRFGKHGEMVRLTCHLR